MADLMQLQEQLKKLGYAVSCFASAQQAADYLDGALDGMTVGFGGSATLEQLGLYERLAAHNSVFWHWKGDDRSDAATAQVYLSSVNGVAMTGELINIDGMGNRVAASVYGHQKVYFVVGRNKVADDFHQALWRARNIAAPKNAQRLKKKTPCAVKGDRCYDCGSPERICRAMMVLLAPPMGMETEVILVDEELGM